MGKATDFQRIFENNPAATLIVELSGPRASSVQVVTANPAALQLFEVSHSSDLSAMFEGVFPGSEGAVEDFPEVEKQLTTPKGTPIDVLFVTQPLSDDGPSRRLVVFAKDVTPGRSLQRRLEWLSVLPEANPNIVVIVGCPNTIDYVNPAGMRWLADRNLRSPEGIRALLPDDFGANYCEGCDRVSGDKWITEHDERTYDVRRTPLGDRNRCMITIGDVTELRRLSREHELFYNAFHSVRTPIVVTDGQGRIEFVNPQFEDVYGYSKEQAVGEPISIVNSGRSIYRELGYSDDDYDRIFSGLWEAIQDPGVGFWEGEIPNRTADGRVVWVHMLVQAVPLERGEGTCYMGFPVDITDSRLKERKVRLDIYETIAGLAELRDNETGNHMRRVGRYARCLADELGMSRRFQEDILAFAPFHDIGKVGIPDEILLAPRKLSADEFARMQRHTELGAQLFRNKDSLEMAADIALSHHERWDGTGYPNRIAGESIPPCARIVSVCDVYDALTSHRPYKEAWEHGSTVEAIVKGRGTQFEPDAVDAFLARHEEFAEIRRSLPDL